MRGKVELGAFDEEALGSIDLPSNRWYEWHEYSCEKYGVYYTKPFVLEKGTTIEIILITDYPVLASNLDAPDPGGVYPTITHYWELESGGLGSSHYGFDSYEVERSGDTWEVITTVHVTFSGQHVFSLANCSHMFTYCEYSISEVKPEPMSTPTPTPAPVSPPAPAPGPLPPMPTPDPTPVLVEPLTVNKPSGHTAY